MCKCVDMVDAGVEHNQHNARANVKRQGESSTLYVTIVLVVVDQDNSDIKSG